MMDERLNTQQVCSQMGWVIIANMEEHSYHMKGESKYQWHMYSLLSSHIKKPE